MYFFTLPFYNKISSSQVGKFVLKDALFTFGLTMVTKIYIIVLYKYVNSHCFANFM